MWQRLHRKLPTGVAKNSPGYSLQICLTFAVEDLGCLGIFNATKFHKLQFKKIMCKEHKRFIGIA